MGAVIAPGTFSYPPVQDSISCVRVLPGPLLGPVYLGQALIYPAYTLRYHRVIFRVTC